MESLAREAAVFAAAGDHPNCPGARPGRLSTLLSIFHGASLSYGHSLVAKAAAGGGRLATVSGDLRPRNLKFTGLTHNFSVDPAVWLRIPIRGC